MVNEGPWLGAQLGKLGKRNAPICYDFVKGVCKREDCRYSHDLSSIIFGTKGTKDDPNICYDHTRYLFKARLLFLQRVTVPGDAGANARGGVHAATHTTYGS